MITVQREVAVARPLGAVFAYLADFRHTEQWDPGTVRTTRTDDGPLRVGSTFHNVSTYRGRTTELDYRVVRLDPNARLIVHRREPHRRGHRRPQPPRRRRRPAR